MTPPGQPSDRRRSPRLARRRAEAAPAAASMAALGQDSATLAQRAAALARPLPKIAALPTGDAYVVVVVGGQRLGFPSRFVHEAFNVTEITALPGLPAHVLGLANVRSRVLPVFTLTPLFRLPPATGSSTKLLLLTTQRGDFAVPIDELEGIRAVDPASRQPTLSGAAESFVQGMMPDGLLLVDVPAVADELALSDEAILSSPFNSP